MFKMMKWGAIAAGLSILIGGLIFGGNLFSYVSTSARSVRSAVEENVPVEFQLKMALDMVENIKPELDACIEVIAEESYEVNTLRDEIATAEKTLAANRNRLAMMRDQLNTQFASYRDPSQAIERNRAKEQMAGCLSRCKHGETILETKRRLLETRKRSLAAAEQLFDRARNHKAEIEQQIKSLEAKHHLVKAQSIGTTVSIDNSQLARADKLIAKIKRRLEIAEEVLERRAALYPMEETGAKVVVDETELLADVDSYLGADGSQPVNSGRDTVEVASK